MELVQLVLSGKFWIGAVLGIATAIIFRPLIDASLAKLFRKNS